MDGIWFQDGPDTGELSGSGATQLHRVAAASCSGWLAVPSRPARDPAPVLVWLHGGPIGSWTHWLRGWSVPVMLELGYAVLLPDPALSAGYGARQVARGWGDWGGAPLTDVLALMDAVAAGEHGERLDLHRCAAMGGSFGGYLALQLLSRTSRFRCGVIQSAPVDLARFAETSDSGHYFRRELLGYRDNPDLPLLGVPLLLAHGALDRRVPLEQALTLWSRLNQAGPAFERGHRFLYFPDEGHSIRRPGNLRVWYRTVADFLAVHLLGAAESPVGWL